jgi:hypothetical protein
MTRVSETQPIQFESGIIALIAHGADSWLAIAVARRIFIGPRGIASSAGNRPDH